MFAAWRSRLGVYGVVTIIVVVITVIAIAAYGVYNVGFASTPEKAVTTYLDTMNGGDMARLYDMTLGASSQTQAEFAGQLSAVIKDNRLSADASSLQSLGKNGDTRYYRVMARLSTADGSYRTIPLVLAAAQEGKSWQVSIYLPPAALPTGQ
jgi:hypothetical protein